jgi:uncharacterized membrane protein YfcA
MLPLKKRMILWCTIAVAYFVTIFVPLLIYFRIPPKTAPDWLLGLHHEAVVISIFSDLFWKNFDMLDQIWRETFYFLVGIVYYAGTGVLLGLLQHSFGKSRHLRGIFYAFLCSMLGYTIGVWIGGHPPLLIFLNPPLFFLVGYFLGIMTFRPQMRRDHNPSSRHRK